MTVGMHCCLPKSREPSKIRMFRECKSVKFYEMEFADSIFNEYRKMRISEDGVIIEIPLTEVLRKQDVQIQCNGISSPKMR